MKAELLPLTGKYYGTEIRLTDDAGGASTLRIWHQADPEPSERELKSLEDDGPYLLTQEERDEAYRDLVSGGHYESATSLRVARIIVDALSEVCAGLPDRSH